MEKEIGSSGQTMSVEELSYQADLLTASVNQLKEKEQLYQRIAEYAKEGYSYANYGNKNYFASEGFYTLFPESKERLADKDFLADYLEEADFLSYHQKRSVALDNKLPKEEFLYCLKKNSQKKEEQWILQTSHYFYQNGQELCEQISYYEDVTPKINQQKEWERIAYYDSVTKFYNRNYFTIWLDEAVKDSLNEFKKVQLAYLDIDYFNRAIESMGEVMGEEIITHFVTVLKGFQDDKIQIGRFGDDTFVIGFTKVEQSDTAEMFCKRLILRLNEPFFLSDQTTYRMTVSIGIAEYDPKMEQVQELIRAADIAMYQMKHSGRNGIVKFRSDMKKDFRKERKLAEKLEKAVNDNEFYLVYQPQFDISNNQIRGLETLIRWEDEELGQVNPEEFLAIAEANGMMIKIGQWVIEESLKTLQFFVETYKYQGIMSINISLEQFQNGGFFETVKSCTKSLKLNPHQIEIELKEQVFLEQKDASKQFMKEIRKSGYRISLDSFGTGYVSLAFLNEIPMDTIKLDILMVEQMVQDENAGIIANGIIDMMEQLGVEVIAVGVESEEQLAYLKQKHLVRIQGYLLGRPMVKENIEKLVCKIY